MNPKDYRRQVEAELQSSDSGAGLQAAAPQQSPEQAWEQALAQLANPSVPADARLAALQQLQAGTFLGDQFAPYMPRYLAALREAAVDADDRLRHAALDVLINFKDEFARQRLVEGLRTSERALVPPAAALGLLARDDHASVGELARDMLARSDDAHVRAQAVRVLGADPQSKSLLSDIMKDKGEFREVRRASAAALWRLDPGRFESDATDILQDSSDYPEIKATISGALERAGVSPESPSDSTRRR